MKTTLTAVLIFALLAAIAQGADPPKPAESPKAADTAKMKIAIVRVDRILSSDLRFDKIQLLSLDQKTLDMLKKINTEIREVQKKIADAEDESELTDLQKRLDFLNRKASLLQATQHQRIVPHHPSKDVPTVIRDFVARNYKDKYSLILQDPTVLERHLWKGNVEVSDLTDEVLDKFKEYLNQIAGE